MNINYRKSFKLITLIVTSVLIASVAAETYRYMYIDGSVIITSAKMAWYNGGAPGASVAIDGSLATVDLTVEQNTPMLFNNTLYLKNENATGSFAVSVTINTAVLTADFTACNMDIYENSTGTWTFVDTIDLTNSADSYSGSLNAGYYLSMRFDVETTASASGTKPFDVQVTYN